MKPQGKVRNVSAQNIRLAARVVLSGGVIVYPTDTVYGLGCNPRDPLGVMRILEIKGRKGKPLPVLCDSLESVKRLVHLNASGLSLARSHWPGALTIAAPMKLELPDQIHQGTGTLGVRVPASHICISLIRACGGYLVGTSANKSGEPSSRTAKEAFASIGEEVDLILDGGRMKGQESTVVRVVDNRVEVLRKGPVRVLEKRE